MDSANHHRRDAQDAEVAQRVEITNSADFFGTWLFLACGSTVALKFTGIGGSSFFDEALRYVVASVALR